MPGQGATRTDGNFKSFSTAHIPHHERVEFWEAHNADALIGLDIRPLHTQTLDAQQHNRETSHTRAAKVLGSSQLVERTPEMIKKHPTEAVALFFCTQGDSFYSDENSTHVLQAGQMLACNADRPFLRGFGVGVSEMVLTVSMDAYTEITRGKPLTSPVKLTFGSALGTDSGPTAATQLARLVDSSLNASHDQAATFEDQTLSWLESLFHEGQADLNQLFQQAQHFIDLNLAHPNLRRTDLARWLHLSERQVGRVFSAQGTSFSNELLLRRVQAARSILQTEPHAPIADIARRCGFSSTSYFSRSFRKVLGHSPSEERAHIDY